MYTTVNSGPSFMEAFWYFLQRFACVYAGMHTHVCVFMCVWVFVHVDLTPQKTAHHWPAMHCVKNGTSNQPGSPWRQHEVLVGSPREFQALGRKDTKALPSLQSVHIRVLLTLLFRLPCEDVTTISTASMLIRSVLSNSLATLWTV